MKNNNSILLRMAIGFMGLSPLVHAAVTVGDIIYVDFGPNGVNGGVVMTSPDSNGIHWNNATTNNLSPGGGAVTAPSSLVTSTNVGTGVGLTFSSNWQANSAGGLTTPNPALVGEFAQGNATRDYLFHNTADSGGSATITLTNLDSALTYDITIFATRDNTQTRVTRYLIGSEFEDLQTSGTGIGAGGTNGNNNQFAEFTGLTPTESGTITVTVSPGAGSASTLSYIGAMRVTAVPEPSSAGLLVLGSLALLRRGRAASSGLVQRSGGV